LVTNRRFNKKKRTGSTQAKVLEMMRIEAQTPGQLRQVLNVTPQRIVRLLSKLEEQGLVKRIATVGERSQHLYMLADAPLSIVRSRTPALNQASVRLLSSLDPEQLYRASELGHFLYNFPHTAFVKRRVGQLASLGFVYQFKLGVWLFFGLTPAGFQYRGYDHNAPKAPPIDFASLVGPARAAVLQALGMLGTAKTIELTYAVGTEIFAGKGYGSAHVVHRLYASGLLKEAPASEGKRRAYRLSRMGAYVATILARYQEPPRVEWLRARIAEGLAQKSLKRLSPADTAGARQKSSA